MTPAPLEPAAGDLCELTLTAPYGSIDLRAPPQPIVWTPGEFDRFKVFVRASYRYEPEVTARFDRICRHAHGKGSGYTKSARFYVP
ncbi:MAG: hypothetical protein HY049_06930 [Acidobacteria bacterium]|nr:hypothetical protein [Acidobacteriota bacterium]